MNLRPSGYEPDELPDCSIPRFALGIPYGCTEILPFFGKEVKLIFVKFDFFFKQSAFFWVFVEFQEQIRLIGAEFGSIFEPTDGNCLMFGDAEALIKAEKHEKSSFPVALHGGVADVFHRFFRVGGSAEPLGIELSQDKLGAWVIPIGGVLEEAASLAVVLLGADAGSVAEPRGGGGIAVPLQGCFFEPVQGLLRVLCGALTVHEALCVAELGFGVAGFRSGGDGADIRRTCHLHQQGARA